VYNGSHTELNLFQAATGASFPLLQMAVNGTVYGAFRDEMMLIDQTGKQILLTDVRRDPNWLIKMTTEIDRLLNLPVARVVAHELMLDSLRVGQSVTQTVSIVNDGKVNLTLGRVTTDIEGLHVTLPGQTVSGNDTLQVALVYSPTSEGPIRKDFDHNTRGRVG